MDLHKICFTTFGAQKLEIWFFARLQEIWNLNKIEEGAVVSLTAGTACQVLFPLDRGDVHRRFLRDSEVSGQTKGTNMIPRHLRAGWPPFPHGGSAEVLGDTPELSGR